MENFEFLKKKLIRAINESSDRDLIFKLWEMFNSEEKNVVSEPQSVYESDKPMTDEEVEEYFKEEEMKLHPVYIKMIERGLEDVKNARVIDNDDVEKYFDEWLKN